MRDASRRLPRPSPQATREGRSRPSHPHWLAVTIIIIIVIYSLSPSDPVAAGAEVGEGRDAERYKLFHYFLSRGGGKLGQPPAEGVWGGGEPRRRLTAGRGRGLRGWRGRGMEERAWERGSRSCGRASPHPKLPHKAAAALGSHPILCVFHQGLMGRGCPCFPEPAAPPPRGGGQGPLPGMAATTGVPGWAQTRGGCGSPRISPPLTRVAPGYQQH